MDDRKTIIRLDDPSFEWKEDTTAAVPAAGSSAGTDDVPLTETIVEPAVTAVPEAYQEDFDRLIDNEEKFGWKYISIISDRAGTPYTK